MAIVVKGDTLKKDDVSACWGAVCLSFSKDWEWHLARDQGAEEFRAPSFLPLLPQLWFVLPLWRGFAPEFVAEKGWGSAMTNL